MEDQPVVQPNTESKSRISKRLVVLLVILGVIVGGYFVSAKYGFNLFSSKEAAIPTYTPQDNELAGWQTYRNEKYGFEVKYPTGWTVRPISETLVFPRQYMFGIENSNNDKEWIGLIVSSDPEIPNQGFESNFVVGRSISGLPAKQYLLPPSPYDTPILKYLGLWVEKNGKNFALIFYNMDKINKTYDQILSTFKFIK